MQPEINEHNSWICYFSRNTYIYGHNNIKLIIMGDFYFKNYNTKVLHAMAYATSYLKRKAIWYDGTIIVFHYN